VKVTSGASCVIHLPHRCPLTRTPCAAATGQHGAVRRYRAPDHSSTNGNSKSISSHIPNSSEFSCERGCHLFVALRFCHTFSVMDSSKLTSANQGRSRRPSPAITTKNPHSSLTNADARRTTPTHRSNHPPQSSPGTKVTTVPAKTSSQPAVVHRPAHGLRSVTAASRDNWQVSP
jgi:hypothetical protein